VVNLFIISSPVCSNPRAPRLAGGFAPHLHLIFLNIGLFVVSVLWIAMLKTFISQRDASQVQ